MARLHMEMTNIFNKNQKFGRLLIINEYYFVLCKKLNLSCLKTYKQISNNIFNYLFNKKTLVTLNMLGR